LASRFLGRKKRPQRRHLVLQHVSDARARPCELPYLFPPASGHFGIDHFWSILFVTRSTTFIVCFSISGERAGVPAVRFWFPRFRKSHAICGTVCGAPREAFSSSVFPDFLGQADDDVEQLQLAAQINDGSFREPACRVLRSVARTPFPVLVSKTIARF